MNWVSEELNRSGFRDTPTDLGEEHGGTLTDVHGDPRFSQLPLNVAGTYLHAANRPAVHRYRYTHRCDMLRSPANHRPASKAVA